MEAGDATETDDDHARAKERDARLDAALRASGVILAPHPHQRTAVRWWLTREGTKPEDRATPSGGILADEMGLGKSMSAVMSVLLVRSVLTGQSVPRVRAAPARPGAWAVTSAPVAAPGRASAGGPVVLPPTLIVCPKGLLLQWQREILRHTTLAPDDLHLYYGRAGRRATRRQVADKVFVLTTYETVLGSFERLCTPRPSRRRAGAPLGVAPPPAGQGVDADGRLVDPLCASTDDAAADAPAASARKEGSWGGGGASSIKDTGGSDKGGNNSVLHDIVWDRIVLDEAHVIRNWQASKTHRAVCALRADRRWCLTGTAFNNSASDVVALCRFVGVAPYADPRWWTAPDDDQVDAWRRAFLLRRTKAALLVPATVPAPLQTGGHLRADDADLPRGTICTAAGASAMTTTMADPAGASAAAATAGPASMPPKVEKVRRVPLSEREAAFYDRLAVGAVADFGAFTRSRGADKSRMFGQMLEWLTRLRQACCDPLVLKGRAATIVYSPASLADRGRHESHCVRCHVAAADLPPPAALGRLTCGHVSCADCTLETGADCVLCVAHQRPATAMALATPMTTTTTPTTPTMTTAESGTARSGPARAVVVATEPACGPSSRTASMVRFMNKIFAKDARAKMVVFSQWSTYLDLIESAVITRVGVGYVRIDGGVRQIERRNALVDRFTSDADARCLLMTIGVGSVGLNLVCANYVLLMDAHYNPFAEAQAVDRVHRIGQTRPVRVMRFRSDASVDAAVAQIQAAKRVGAAAFLEGAAASSASRRHTMARGIDEHQLRSILKDMIAARRDVGDQAIDSFVLTASSRTPGTQRNVGFDMDDDRDEDDEDDEYTDDGDDNDDIDDIESDGDDDSGRDRKRRFHVMDSDESDDEDDDDDDEDEEDDDGDHNSLRDNGDSKEDAEKRGTNGETRDDNLATLIDDLDRPADEHDPGLEHEARAPLRRLKRTADVVRRRRDTRTPKRRRRFGPLA
ncbi:SNF2 family DNA dependent ATPase [Pandoravirus dulcis]|uniref:SNF2 family DNA dependent ATPase n=1 Tax=Pandoravirus dulcis TaxID=1349409 RepID=S4VVV6_9VIRU|nr:SNF2 family DNA dependent ATPase [Pandoravirus dulcis]AGO82236.1 SNF2 family DNA dependent ATPase [Pandoravirus dulcis]